MNSSELRTILGYLNIGLAIAHNTGVSGGHFGNTDFIELAQTVNGLFLSAIAKPGNGLPVVGEMTLGAASNTAAAAL